MAGWTHTPAKLRCLRIKVYLHGLSVTVGVWAGSLPGWQEGPLAVPQLSIPGEGSTLSAL